MKVHSPLHILIVDDERPALTRLENLLSDIADQHPNIISGRASNGVEALSIVAAGGVDLIITDISMPVMDGIELARHTARLPSPPSVIFVTAYNEYAVEAFEIAAIDYLLKPTRAERLAAALEKLSLRHHTPAETALKTLQQTARQYFSSNERERVLLIPVADVLYLKAELKYVTARTIEREYILNESLTQIEQEFPEHFLRVHRNCLVAYTAIAGIEKEKENTGEPRWEILLNNLDERLPISRRQWPTVRLALGR